jgi:hypothetical protein
MKRCESMICDTPFILNQKECNYSACNHSRSVSKESSNSDIVNRKNRNYMEESAKNMTIEEDRKFSIMDIPGNGVQIQSSICKVY